MAELFGNPFPEILPVEDRDDKAVVNGMSECGCQSIPNSLQHRQLFRQRRQ